MIKSTHKASSEMLLTAEQHRKMAAAFRAPPKEWSIELRLRARMWARAHEGLARAADRRERLAAGKPRLIDMT